MIIKVNYWFARRDEENGFDFGEKQTRTFDDVAATIRWLKDHEDCLAVNDVEVSDNIKTTYLSIDEFVNNMVGSGAVKAVPYILLQLRRDAETDPARAIRFQNLRYLREKYGNAWEPDPALYTVAYEGIVYVDAATANSHLINDLLWKKFNSIARPNRLYACSMSVSDINIIGNDAYYVDSIGFEKLKDFDWQSICGDDAPIKKERLRRFMLTGDFDGMTKYLRSNDMELC